MLPSYYQLRCARCSWARMKRIHCIVLVCMLYVCNIWILAGANLDLEWSIVIAVFGVLSAVSFVHVLLIDPGCVPEEWQTKVRELGKASGYPVCRRTGQYKPPRSHYDSVTGRLVLNMDHFCPWLDNCIGFYNKKFFLLFVCYSSITLILCSYVLLNLNYTHRRVPDVVGLLLIGVDALLGVGLGIFGTAHLYMASQNATTIERTNFHTYDNGWLHNLRTILGTSICCWPIPCWFVGTQCDGVHWECSDGSVDGSLPRRTDAFV